MKYRYVVPQEIAPQHGWGVDFGSNGKVLVRTKDRLLIWRKPGKCWSGIGMPYSYVPAYLHVIATDPKTARNYGTIGGRDLMKGGRLSTVRLLCVIEKLRDLLSLPNLEAKDIDLKKTMVVD